MQATFEEVYELLERSFPESEIRTLAGQRKLLERPEYRLLTKQGEDGELLAVMAVWEFDNLRFVEHIAVHPRARGLGLGGEMMREYQHAAGRVPVILEVEPPDTTEFAGRRIGFYERLGFFLNRYPYKQPPLREGQPDLPLLLMSYPGPLTQAEFRQCVSTLYTRVYEKWPADEAAELLTDSGEQAGAGGRGRPTRSSDPGGPAGVGGRGGLNGRGGHE